MQTEAQLTKTFIRDLKGQHLLGTIRKAIAARYSGGSQPKMAQYKRYFKKYAPDLYDKYSKDLLEAMDGKTSRHENGLVACLKVACGEQKFLRCAACNQVMIPFGLVCSTSCGSRLAQTEEVRQRRTLTCLKKYGVENPMSNLFIAKKSAQAIRNRPSEQKLEHQRKIAETVRERYGADNVLKSDWFVKSNFMLKKYGVSHASQREESREKSKKTCLDRYGVPYATQTNEVKAKVVSTCQRKYGTNCSMQNRSVLDKALKSRYRFVDVKIGRKTLSLQGYEPATAKLLHSKGYEVDIPDFSIAYKFDDVSRRYYADLVAVSGSHRFLVEVKSSFTLRSDLEKNLAKFRAANRYCRLNGMIFAVTISARGQDEPRIVLNPTKRKLLLALSTI